ncbi:MAG: DUF4105 domain-containing protein [Bacteroidota bacterium]
MRKIIFIALLLFSINGLAQTTELSKGTEIYVVTCGPFQGELYSAFGHSAFRVYDPETSVNWIYNYGVFDFNQPNFYLNFARGNLNYKLGVQQYRPFRDFYIYYNRFVHEQQLNLTHEQKQKLFDFLEWNALPENQYYRYDYFYDNCATKIRDVVQQVFGDSVKFDDSYIQTNYSIRDLCELYLKHQPWGDLGIDICLGLPMDKKASPFEYMFLPDYIESSFGHATIINSGAPTPLVKANVITYQAQPEEITMSLFHPWIIFGLLFIAGGGLTYHDFRTKKLSKWFDTILFGAVGCVGLLLLLLWIATDHKAAAANFNLLWAVPTHLILLIWFWIGKKPNWFTGYFKLIGLLQIALVVVWFVLPQQLNVFLIPLVLLLAIRCWIIARLTRLQ